MRILVVRLSSLGDVVHAIPVAAALRDTFPDAQIDWLVDERYAELINIVSVVDHCISAPMHRGTWRALPGVVNKLRAVHYELAIDLQGLLKSAALARATGARRVIGFEPDQLRERSARWLYTETLPVDGSSHVIQKNLSLVSHLGGQVDRWAFPIAERPSAAVVRTREMLSLGPEDDFALINPGTAWSSKCWAPERFGALARQLWETHRLRSAVSWGPGEDARAEAVVEASAGVAARTPPTSIADLVALARAACVMVGGDTGPLHVAAAVQTPVVGVYGPSDPGRNGPWAPADVVVSRFQQCRCQQERSRSGGVVVRRCLQPSPCLDDISVDAVVSAVERRLSSVHD